MMKKLFVFIFFLSIAGAAHSQAKYADSVKTTSQQAADLPEPVQKYLTSKYAGTYDYGKDDTLSGTGMISIYPETDTTVLFYIIVVSGVPSYNMGDLYGRIKIQNDTGSFETRFDDSKQGCKWAVSFTKDSLTIQTVSDAYECGFGNAVYADGVYKRESSESPEYFEDPEGKFYFNETTPEHYYRGIYNSLPELSLRIKNVSKYFIRELKLKTESSIVYFRDISPDELSEKEGLSSIGDSGWITVQLLRKRLFKTRLTIIHKKISLDAPRGQDEQVQKGTFILNFDVPKSKDPTLKTTLEKQ